MRGKRLDTEGGIRTRARARGAEEQWSSVALPLKIALLLTDAFIEATTQGECCHSGRGQEGKQGGRGTGAPPQGAPVVPYQSPVCNLYLSNNLNHHQQQQPIRPAAAAGCSCWAGGAGRWRKKMMQLRGHESCAVCLGQGSCAAREQCP